MPHRQIEKIGPLTELDDPELNSSLWRLSIRSQGDNLYRNNFYLDLYQDKEEPVLFLGSSAKERHRAAPVAALLALLARPQEKVLFELHLYGEAIDYHLNNYPDGWQLAAPEHGFDWGEEIVQEIVGFASYQEAIEASKESRAARAHLKSQLDSGDGFYLRRPLSEIILQRSPII
jgi:hypothetical protein